MEENRRREIAAPAIAALLAAFLTAYIIAFFQLGEFGTAHVAGNPPATVRIYRNKWQADLFTPGVVVESWIRGRPIGTAYTP
jgi:hypothetical protein